MTEINKPNCLSEIILALFNKDQNSVLIIHICFPGEVAWLGYYQALWIWFIQLLHLHFSSQDGQICVSSDDSSCGPEFSFAYSGSFWWMSYCHPSD